MKFVCLGYFDEAAWQMLPESRRETLVTDCLQYDEELKRAGHWRGGEALQSHLNGATIRIQDGSVAVTDGPFAESKEQIGGILYLEARDLNHAIALMSRHPGLCVGPFEIRPVDEDFMKFAAQLAQTLPRSNP